MIEIEIDDKKIEVAPGAMVIEAADNAGIKIPRFCYHKKLSVAANCRMCLVEVEKAPKPLPACATPVTAGMKVYTQSARALDAQKSVMEFLLINHPLDCPICDQGGSCELQDISMGYGQDFSRYEDTKRVVKDENLGALIATDMTRCIQCTRCVRFGYEVAGVRELGTLGRGDRMEIGSYLKSHALKSELSGNIIDLCPVGALTSKPFRFKARAWELSQATSIAPHDGLGSHIYCQTRHDKIMRVVPRENEAINETWISDRDRFSYQGLYSEDRLTKPMIKKDNQWVETDWTEALALTAQKLKAIKEAQGAHEIAAIASPNSTLEEFYLLQKWMRGMGSHHIDHRIHEIDTADQSAMPLYPGLGMPIEALQDQDVILLIGSHINHEHPLIAHRIRKAFLQGAKILCINPMDFEFAFTCENKIIASPQKILEVLSDENLFAEYFNAAGKKSILLGALALNHPQASQIRCYARRLAEKHQAALGYLYEGANNAGAWIAGCIPTSTGMAVHQALQAKLRAYVLLGIEPDLDLAQPGLALNALKSAECVIALSAYQSKALLDCADILLPISAFAETSGTYVNLQGDFQSFHAVVSPPGETRPAWKILRVLGNFFQLPHFECADTQEICEEIKNLFKHKSVGAGPRGCPDKGHSVGETPRGCPERIIEWPMYRVDPLVRRGVALQQSASAEPVCVKLNAHTSAKYDLSKINNINISTKIDAAVPDDCIWIPAGFEETVSLLSGADDD